MKSKLKARFLPPTYLHKKYTLPHHLTPTLPTFDEVCMFAHKVEQPPKRELVKPPPKEQPLNKGSSSHPSKPVTPSFPIPQKNQAQQNSPLPQHHEQPFNKEEEENLEVCMMEELDEVVEKVEEGGLLDLRRSLPTTEKPLKDGGVLSTFVEPNPEAEPIESIVFNDSNLKSYFVDGKHENLRTNSFLDGENDVYLLGVHFNFFNPTSWELKEDRALCLMEESQEEAQEEVVEEPDDGNSASEAIIILDSPQKLEEEQAGVTQEFEPYLIQEECPYHQQELRTILFQQGENDGYLLGHPLHTCETSAFEVTSCQIPAWTDLSSSPLFEFRGKRHFMEFYMNFKRPFLKRHINRDQSYAISMVKEIQKACQGLKLSLAFNDNPQLGHPEGVHLFDLGFLTSRRVKFDLYYIHYL